MNRLLLFCILLFGYQSTFAQRNPEEFDQMFKKGILLLGSNQHEEAFDVINSLYRADSTNMNLAYLTGRCLVEMDTLLPYSSFLLEKAKESYSPDYRRGKSNERKVSEYVYYYLIKSYSLQGRCDMTLPTLNDFYRIYSYDNEWYLINGQELHLGCEMRERPEPVLLGESPVDTVEVIQREIGTKKLFYSNRTDEYGVQVGATLEPVYTYEFKGLKNIDVYVDNNGIYRYVMGRFNSEKQAERLLDVVMDEGYDDAFIVNLKDIQKFSEAVVFIDNEPINKRIYGKVDFRVQIGAFEGDTIPDDLLHVYFQLDDIKENNQGDLTLMTVGSFDTYEEASFYKELVQDIGVEDAFVVAYNNGRKVDVKQAKIYVEEKREQEEREAEQEEEKNNKKKRK